MILLDSINNFRLQVIKAGHELLKKGLVAGTWGNISSRIPESNLIAVTPSGCNYLNLSEKDIVIVDLEGNVIDGTLKPTSELLLHLTIYNARKDVQAIVHTHSVFASALAVAHKSIPPIIEDLVQLAGGSVDVAQYALPGTNELAQNAVKALGTKNAVLMANHGAVGCGQSLREAMTACELVEKSAQIYIYANQIGGANVLSDNDIKIMHDFYKEHYRHRQEDK